jgi:hypothetical protein
MRINADFSKPALVVPSEDAWACSPESGVDRLMLDRIGDEVARATSIVRYAAGSEFHEHLHAKGEEFLVLEGVFSDEQGDYPAGTYVRNPPGSRHAPGSRDGCRILVKLRQFDPQDLAHIVMDTNDDALWNGLDKLALHRFGQEQVEMKRVAGGELFQLDAGAGGVEILLVSGKLMMGDQQLLAESWLRLPSGGQRDLVAQENCVIWLKRGHLPAGPG